MYNVRIDSNFVKSGQRSGVCILNNDEWEPDYEEQLTDIRLAQSGGNAA